MPWCLFGPRAPHDDVIKWNPPVTGGIPSRRPSTRSFDYFFDLCLNKRLSKQSRRWLLRRHRAHYDVTVMRRHHDEVSRSMHIKNASTKGISYINRPVERHKQLALQWRMMTSSNGNIFRVTGPLCGEFTGPGEFPTQRPVTRSFDVFFDLRLNKRLSKQPWGWWFETLSWSLWRQCNVLNSSTNRLFL